MMEKVMKIKSSLNKNWWIKRKENKTETSMKWMIGVRSKYPRDNFVEWVEIETWYDIVIITLSNKLGKIDYIFIFFICFNYINLLYGWILL